MVITTIEALQRQQQRIVHRTALLEYVLTAEQRGGSRLTLGDAPTELLTDISGAQDSDDPAAGWQAASIP